MSYERFVTQVMQGGAFERRKDAEMTIAATLSALAESASMGALRATIEELPEGIGRLLVRESDVMIVVKDELEATVARRAGLSLGFAQEAVVVVLGVLALWLPAHARRRLSEGLPPTIAALLVPPAARSA